MGAHLPRVLGSPIHGAQVAIGVMPCSQALQSCPVSSVNQTCVPPSPRVPNFHLLVCFDLLIFSYAVSIDTKSASYLCCLPVIRLSEHPNCSFKDIHGFLNFPVPHWFPIMQGVHSGTDIQLLNQNVLFHLKLCSSYYNTSATRM